MRLYRVPLTVLAVAALVAGAVVPSLLKVWFFALGIALLVVAGALTWLSVRLRLRQSRRPEEEH